MALPDPVQLDAVPQMLHHRGYRVRTVLKPELSRRLVDAALDERLPGAQVLKDHRHNLVVRCQCDGQDLLLKVPRSRNRRPLREGLMIPLRGSASWREWHSQRQLRRLGFASPEPVLLAERRFLGCLTTASFLYSRWVEGGPVPPIQLPALVAAMQALHAKGYTRRDSLVRNFVWDGSRPVFIDVGLKRPLLLRRLRCAMEFAHFLHHCPAAQEHADPAIIASRTFALGRRLFRWHGLLRGRWRALSGHYRRRAGAEP